MFFRLLLPRVFVIDTVLPFLGRGSKSEGRFGKVSQYDIHPEDHGLPHAGHQVRYWSLVTEERLCP